MTNSFTYSHPNAPRTAGALYLAIAVFGGFSIGILPMQIIVENDIVATISNLHEKFALFQAGMAADMIVIWFELAVTAILFNLFKSKHPKLATIAFIARFGMIGIMGLNMLLWVTPYLLTTPDTVASGLDENTRLNLAALFYKVHSLGVMVWQIFFAAHLLAMGTMILRDIKVPHILGWGLLIGSFGYLLQAVLELTFFNSQILDFAVVGLLVVVSISEISFALWLLIRGNRGFARSR